MKAANDKWHLRYLDLAWTVGDWSKDTTKIGAVAVGSYGQILSQGYNGFPRGVRDTEERLSDRETKLRFTVHAEMNCIYNASLSGASLDGATMYVHGLPTCSECAKGIIQAGVRHVVCRWIEPIRMDVWRDSWKLSRQMFDEAGVTHRVFGCDAA